MLYFLLESMPNKPLPDDLIDTNVRIDYGKRRHLLLWWVSCRNETGSSSARAVSPGRSRPTNA